MNRITAVIPHYRHENTIESTVADILAQQIDCIVVDDASGEQAKPILQHLANTTPAHIIWRKENGGKGAAVIQGMEAAAKQGYTHALQIDADRQHHFADIPKFLALAEQHPDALICANPIYGADAPKSRRYGRKITNFWNWVHTGSRVIKDGMCGFRLYPLKPTLAIIKQHHIGERMDFDTEILIRLYWSGMPLHWIDSPVRYAEDGISHFKMWRDNWDISKMHSRLFFASLKHRFQRHA